MSISLVQGPIIAQGSSTTPSVTIPNVSAGNLLVLQFVIGSLNTISVAPSGNSNTYTQRSQQALSGTGQIVFYEVLSANSGSTTVTMTIDTTHGWFVYAYEVNTTVGTWNFDAEAHAQNGTGSGTAASGALANKQPTEILFAFAEATQSVTAGTASWTADITTGLGSEYIVLNSLSSNNATFTLAASGTWLANVAGWYPAAAANTYYVSTGGNDSNSGLSPGAAWATLTPVNQHNYVPGDTILFNGGNTFSGGITVTISGTNGNPITFNSYGTGVATISSPSGTHGAYAHNCGYISIQNLNFTGPALSTADSHGLYFFVDQSNTTYNFLRVNNCIVTGYTTGIYLKGNSAWHTSPQNGYNDVRITNCTVHDNSNNGINISDSSVTGAYSNVYIGYCVVYNHPGLSGLSNWGGSGIQVGVTTTGTVEYCSAYNNGTNMSALTGAVGIWTAGSNGVTIQFCESYNNTSSSADGDGFDIDGECTNCIIQYCYSHGNKGAGYLLAQYTGANTWNNNIIRFNISEKDGFGIGFYGETSVYLINNGSIYNNTIYCSLGPCLNLEGGDDGSFHGTNLIVDNNIFVTSNQTFTNTAGGSAGMTFSNNDYYAIAGSAQWPWFGTTYTSLATWGQDAHGLTSNPLLTSPGGGGTVGDATKLTTLSAYKLLQGSPMPGAGATIGSPGTQDFYGNLLAGHPAGIGADILAPVPPPPVVPGKVAATKGRAWYMILGPR